METPANHSSHNVNLQEAWISHLSKSSQVKFLHTTSSTGPLSSGHVRQNPCQVAESQRNELTLQCSTTRAELLCRRGGFNE